MSKMVGTNVFDAHNKRYVRELIENMERDTTAHWPQLRNHHNCLRPFADYDEFVGFCETRPKRELYTPIFTPVADHYRTYCDQMSANLLIIMASAELGVHVTSRRLTALIDYEDKWNCVVEVFLRTIKEKLDYSPRYSRLLEFVRSAVRNEERNLLKQASHTFEVYDDNLAYRTIWDVVKDDIEAATDDACLKYLINCPALSERCRAIIKWLYIDVKSYRDYAETLKTTENAVRNIFYRMKPQAKSILEKEFPDIAEKYTQNH